MFNFRHFHDIRRELQICCFFKPVVNIKYSSCYGDFLIRIVLFGRMTKYIWPTGSGLFMPCRNKVCVLDILTEASVAIVLTERMTLIGLECIKQANLAGQETPITHLSLFFSALRFQAGTTKHVFCFCCFFCLFFLSHKNSSLLICQASTLLTEVPLLPVSTLDFFKEHNTF